MKKFFFLFWKNGREAREQFYIKLLAFYCKAMVELTGKPLALRCCERKGDTRRIDANVPYYFTQSKMSEMLKLQNSIPKFLCIISIIGMFKVVLL